MKLIILLGLTCTVAATVVEDIIQFHFFKNKFGKSYKDHEEEASRFSIFRQTLREITEHNIQWWLGITPYKKGVNQFADMTKEEFIALLTASRAGQRNMDHIMFVEKIGSDPPDSIDWRQKGAVSPVKDQFPNCGSCWAFSTTGVLESHYYLKKKQMVLFSEQQLVDCDTTSFGCKGGFVENGLSYILENGIETEGTYPYNGLDNICHHNQNESVPLKIKSIGQLKPKDESLLLNAVGLVGPISVALDATDLINYQEGVYTGDCSQDNLNHAVLAVGYGHDRASGLDYWLVKNSWGDNFGEGGYFRIKRGDNHCGIATRALYPILDD